MLLRDEHTITAKAKVKGGANEELRRNKKELEKKTEILQRELEQNRV